MQGSSSTIFPPKVDPFTLSPPPRRLSTAKNTPAAMVHPIAHLFITMLLLILPLALPFTPSSKLVLSHRLLESRLPPLSNSQLPNSGGLGQGGEAEWSKALQESVTQAPGSGEAQMKMAGLLSGPTPALAANAALIKWLEDNGVYLSDSSGWTVAPHPLAVSTETVDEVTNESTGRGLLARRSVNVGDELLQIPLDLCLTKDKCLEQLQEQDIVKLPRETNEYLIIATYLIHEKYINPDSFWRPYLDVLPTTEDVGPTFTWTDEDLSQLGGSPVVAATKSMRLKLASERSALLESTGLNPDDYTYEVRAVARNEHVELS